jgi:hypothetical protein
MIVISPPTRQGIVRLFAWHRLSAASVIPPEEAVENGNGNGESGVLLQ